MPCTHLLRPACGCPPDPPLIQPAHKPKNKGGRPPAPWKVRYGQEYAERERRDREQIEILQQMEDAVLRGQGKQVLDKLTGLLSVHSFSSFCQNAWHVVEKSVRLEWGRHHELLCTTLQALFEDWLKTKSDPDHIPQVLNCVVNCPPGTLKSKIVSVFFPVWCWLRCPGMKFICLSVNEKAAVRDALAARDIVRSSWYQDTFQPTWSLRGDHDAVTDYSNTEGGGRLSQASGSEIVGLRGDCLLLDDPNNPNDSSNKAERKAVNELWDNNQFNRVNDPGKSLRIGIQQRVHSDDWTGHVLSRLKLWTPTNRNGWLHVVLPAEFELSRPAFEIPPVLVELVEHLPNIETKDWRTQAGDTLHSRMTKAALDADRIRWAGTGNYAGQMQQRPSSESGDKFKKKYFNWFRLAGGVRDLFDELGERAPRPAECHQGPAEVVHGAHHRPGCWDFDKIVLSVDAAVKKTEIGSLWGMLAVGFRGARRYVLDDRSKRGHPDELMEVLRDMIRFWKPDEILVEDKAGGSGMLRTLEVEMGRGDLPMVAFRGINPGTEDKELRANMALPTFANGFVYLLDGAPWVDGFVEEVCGFPNFSTNDRVDAITQVINDARDDSFQLPGDEAGGWAAAGLG